MIKQILFDCGGVFVDIQFQQLMEKICKDPAKAALFAERLFSKNSPWPLLYDKGELDTQGVYEALLKHIPEIDPAYLQEYMKEWPKWLPTFPQMETLVDELHANGIKCYLLSNFSHRFEEFRQYCPAIKNMDGYVISYQIHMIKPCKEIFDYATAQFGYKAEETMFVDDSIKNVEGSCAAGYQGYHYTDAAALRKHLQELKILP